LFFFGLCRDVCDVGVDIDDDDNFLTFRIFLFLRALPKSQKVDGQIFLQALANKLMDKAEKMNDYE
jgi:hypothetical protein